MTTQQRSEQAKLETYENIAPSKYENRFEGIEKYERIEVDLVSLAVGGRRRGTILDVGVGTGRLARIFPEATIYGMDVCLNFVHYCKEKQLKNLNLLLADMDALPFKFHAFDSIILLGTLESHRDPIGLCKSLIEYIHPGGCIILTFWNSRNLIARFLNNLDKSYPRSMFSNHYVQKSLRNLQANYGVSYKVWDYWVMPSVRFSRFPRPLSRILIKLVLGVSLSIEKVNGFLGLHFGGNWMVCIEKTTEGGSQ